MKKHNKKEDKKPNKTAFIRVRCTAEEKERIRSRAANAGRKYSDYCREMLLGGSVVAVPPMSENEREALAILRQTALFYARISNLIKVKDASWVDATKALATYAKIAFKRFFSPCYRVDEEVFKRLNIERHDCNM
ncbi:hypothetical protein C7123_09310 [Tannerella serpentiformis]|uniref:plasmid mobilization protein n=1 Tax=Tannerella serpentiformis TaxID=712710 RepID=UPI000840EEFE|nr:hypothetical protein [Tannerella serpentiformis]AOH40001.1 hypothetical protein BCB71_01895 [Tannerella serpentiformis]AVV53879.1 hypothetical protein C7123_09310 [Tannerella serpentiformis]